MPQISQLAATYASQIFWLLLTFGIVFFVVGRGMLPKVQATIDGRDKSIASDLAAASAARDAADQAEEAWRQRDQANREAAQAVITGARAQATKASEATLAAANTEQSAKVAASEADIRAAATRAMSEIEIVAAKAAQLVIVQVSGLQVTINDTRRVVKSILKTDVTHG